MPLRRSRFYQSGAADYYEGSSNVDRSPQYVRRTDAKCLVLHQTSLAPPPTQLIRFVCPRLAMSDFEPIRFVPAQYKAQILKTPVSRIFAVPHAQQDGTNHWCFYLLTPAGNSVAVDCQPSHSIPSTVLAGGSRAFLIVAELASALPPDALMGFPLDVIPGLTVAGVLHKLTEHGRHQYEFDSRGVGCRYWVTNQIDLFSQVGLLVDLKQCAATKAAVAMLWPDRTPLPLDRGVYYQTVDSTDDDA